MKIKQNSILQQIKLDPKYDQRRSKEWFTKKIKELSTTNPLNNVSLLQTTREIQTPRMMIGTMCFFGYDPKHKETLPHYDRFPLSFVFNIDRIGFSGINFHYLSVPMRIKLYDAMWQIATQSNLPTHQVKALTWKLLGNVARFPAASVAVKRYLYGHVRTKFIRVPIEDWKTAILLPVSQFIGATDRSIHRQSLAAVARQLR